MDHDKVSEDYLPLVYNLTPPTDDIMDNDMNILWSNNIEFPRFSNGFHRWIHVNKDKTEIYNEFNGKKRVYLVVNPFETTMFDYDKDINHITNKFFDTTKNPKIMSRGFYKLWECCFYTDLIDLSEKSFVSAHIAEAPGSFVQATMAYRDKYSKYSKNDKYRAISLYSDSPDIPKIKNQFTDFHANITPNRFIPHQTYSKMIADGSPKKSDGDITDPKTIKLFAKDFEKKANFVTAAKICSSCLRWYNSP